MLRAAHDEVHGVGVIGVIGAGGGDGVRHGDAGRRDVRDAGRRDVLSGRCRSVVVLVLVDVALGGMLDGALDEIADVGVSKRIEDVLPGATARDDALGAQEP